MMLGLTLHLQLGRNTRGLTLMHLPADEALVSVMRLDAEEENGDVTDVAGVDTP
jgi:DNA gyrase subunit A